MARAAAAGTDMLERTASRRHRRSGSVAPVDESAALLTPDVSSHEGVERPGELPANLPKLMPRCALFAYLLPCLLAPEVPLPAWPQLAVGACACASPGVLYFSMTRGLVDICALMLLTCDCCCWHACCAA